MKIMALLLTAYLTCSISLYNVYHSRRGNPTQKIRPRTARRATAQLQSLYDSSLSFSSPPDARGRIGGADFAVVSPVVQVCFHNFCLILSKVL